jgi:catechol 2,3-dioxygenase-like lactoylglutathione lyase family enzyme
MTRHGADVNRQAEWDALRARHLLPPALRPRSSARGVHHLALLSSDVERTIAFYQGLLEFPLTELFENRDYEGSTHFFFDIGNGNLLAFFDFPVSTSAITRRCSVGCTISPSPSSPSAGTI